VWGGVQGYALLVMERRGAHQIEDRKLKELVHLVHQRIPLPCRELAILRLRHRVVCYIQDFIDSIDPTYV
jgi:hypothetical protein